VQALYNGSPGCALPNPVGAGSQAAAQLTRAHNPTFGSSHEGEHAHASTPVQAQNGSNAPKQTWSQLPSQTNRLLQRFKSVHTKRSEASHQLASLLSFDGF